MKYVHIIRFARALGFSLAEVTMAVGITAIGSLALVGLMPSGLDSLRQSSAQVAEAKIVQAVTADYQMADWGTRKSGQKLPDRQYYFDDRGVRVVKTDNWKFYEVRTTVDPELPVVKGDPSGNKYLRRLIIKITDRPNADAAFGDPRQYRTYNSMVSLIEQTDSALPIVY
ncbi:uncharacterized protein (TIGR02598 family) [Roseimicrobium gellanilyticum]|uniref:Uncharacterized protein (TIGR02598 family) n=1 Tax=Roseimicrobium gellanilyticum TaxID=748857 RepID=A0A366HBW6_9BACT|nr:Verru_Chthon cassette protein B [Roseimicrobium gellanilyticum]RBP39134.1 uncharacterized protein (TIGR02598 family) [Roseimicrobium gellanilyticum]